MSEPINSKTKMTESEALKYLLDQFKAPLEALQKLRNEHGFSYNEILIAVSDEVDKRKPLEEIWEDYINIAEDPLEPEDALLREFYTVADMTEEEKQPPQFIINGLLPVGLTFLCGAPKTRKSFMALQMAICVAKGEPFLNFETTKCDVIYFDLEGSKSRTAQRTEGIDVPRNVLIKNDTKVHGLEGVDKPLKIAKIDERNGGFTLTDYIRLIHAKHPSFKLFIIDTYSHARGTPRTFGSNAYDTDVELLEDLQRMATNEQIAVVCIHHNKKGADRVTDVFEAASGTMGISGSADCYISLSTEGKRKECRARMDYTPKDAEGGELLLDFNSVTRQWQISIDNSLDYMGNPLYAFCVNNKPEKKGTVGKYFSYEDVYKSAYGISIDRPGDAVQKSLGNNIDILVSLLQDHSMTVQLGARNGADGRGIRLIAL